MGVNKVIWKSTSANRLRHFSLTLRGMQGVSLPATQSSANYLLLAVIYGSYILFKRKAIRGATWAYAALALIDVQANMLIVAAFRYTSITSVTLLDCATIPAVMGLSYFVFRARYRLGHIVGAGLCICGLAVLLLSDRTTPGAGSRPLLGDLLVLMGAGLYAVGNVMQESLLGDAEVSEVLGMMGCFGSMWSALAVVALERKQLTEVVWEGMAPLYAGIFTVAMFMYYSSVPLMLKWHSAAFMNVSLLTSDLWAAIARIFFFGGFTKSAAVYFSISLALVAMGLITYALAPHIYGIGSLKQGGTSYKLAQTGTYTFAPPEKPAVLLRPWQGAAVDLEAILPAVAPQISGPAPAPMGLEATSQGSNLVAARESAGSAAARAPRGTAGPPCCLGEGSRTCPSTTPSAAALGPKDDVSLNDWPIAGSVQCVESGDGSGVEESLAEGLKPLVESKSGTGSGTQLDPESGHGL
eukprot:jgi/Botrbrau1/9571/Bobra.0089s0025.2